MFAVTMPIDTAIPGCIGLLLVVVPCMFFRASGDEVSDAASVRKFLSIGIVLLGIAALYAVIRLAM
jgi:hypothetical protein